MMGLFERLPEQEGEHFKVSLRLPLKNNHYLNPP